MLDEQVELTLEQKYIEKSMNIFPDADSNLIQEITKTISDISSSVVIILNNRHLSSKQKNEVLSDIDDFIPSNLKNNKDFSNLLAKFLHEKVKSLQTSTRESTENILNQSSINQWIMETWEDFDGTIDDKIENILNLSQKIQKYIVVIKNYKQDVEWMGEVLCPKILNIANKLLYDVKNWLDENLPEIDLCIRNISNLLIAVEKERNKSGLTEDQENNVYSDEWDYLTNESIIEIKSLIQEINSFISVYEEQIEHVSLLKISIDKEQNDIAEDNSREKMIIQEMLWLFDESYKNRILGNILHMYEWVEDIINSDLSHSEKINELKNPFKVFEPAFLDDNETAIALLRTLVEIKIERYKISVNKNIYGIRHNIPKKYFISVVLLLNKIVEEYLGNNKDNEAKKIIIRRKCALFIEELDKVIPKFLQGNKEKKDFDIFKTQDIKNILRELKISERFHVNFMKIVDLYYKDKKENIVSENIEKSKIVDELGLAYSELKEGLKDCSQNMLVLCEKFIIHVQINLPLEISKRMIDKINKERISHEPMAWTADIIKKMQRNTLLTSSINETPYDKALDKSSSKNEKKSIIPTQLSGKKPPESIEDKIINNFFAGYPHITNEDIKNKLRLFINTYYKYLLREGMKKYYITRKLFADIKDKKES